MGNFNVLNPRQREVVYAAESMILNMTHALNELQFKFDTVCEATNGDSYSIEKKICNLKLMMSAALLVIKTDHEDSMEQIYTTSTTDLV